MTAILGLDLAERYVTDVCAILRRCVPGYEVWAYGSRVTGGAFEASDLDVLTRDPGRPAPALQGVGRPARRLRREPVADARGCV
jgi:hypothetical protein